MAKLTLDDIAEPRAYERERDSFRAEVIALKARRRVHVGPVVTVLFENAVTIRFQVQEMVRAEKIMTDAGVTHELDTYNPLVPAPGHLAATLFIELTSEEQLREWLPKLVGIESAVELRIGEGADPVVVRCLVDPAHEKQLTRDEVTASVHYVHFSLTPDQIERFAAGPVRLAVALPVYADETVLGDDTRAELLSDLRHGG
jgi:hypothetical protein